MDIKKISNKILFSYSSLIICLVLVLQLFFNDLVKTTHLNIIKREMSEKLHFIELIIEEKPHVINDIPKFNKLINNVSKIVNLRVTIIDFSGVVLVDTVVNDISKFDNHKYRIEIKESMMKGFGDSIRYSDTLKIEMLYSVFL